MDPTTTFRIFNFVFFRAFQDIDFCFVFITIFKIFWLCIPNCYFRRSNLFEISGFIITLIFVVALVAVVVVVIVFIFSKK